MAGADCIEDGVASAVAASPQFEIRLRLVQVKRRFPARMEARLGERERIARTLHDPAIQMHGRPATGD